MTKGERIKLLREKANMTQEELAKLLNTVLKTRTTITGTSRDCMMRSQRFMRRHPARWRGVSETPYPCAGCRRRTRPLIIFSLT